MHFNCRHDFPRRNFLESLRSLSWDSRAAGWAGAGAFSPALRKPTYHKETIEDFRGRLSLEREEISLESAIPFAGRYILKKLLGSGGMGAVYLAVDSMLGDDEVALKILHSQLCQNEKHTKRFLREVQLTRKVTHPNVVRTFDAGRENGRLYFTMEYAQGVTLKDKLVAGPMEIEQSASIVREISKGLYAIHQADIIHRDLKPGNVLLTSAGFIKITDFGVAKPGVSDLTGHNEVIGSIPYMAPEVWVGRNVGVQADIYALGILTYEMVTGVLPFEGDSPAEMMCKHLETVPVAPIELRPELPLWFNDLILLMLQKDQINRPSGAEELVKRINLGLDNESGSSPLTPIVKTQEEELMLVDETFSAPPAALDVPNESIIERVWAGRAAAEQPKYVQMPTIEHPDAYDFAAYGVYQRAARHCGVFVFCCLLVAVLMWRYLEVVVPWLKVSWDATQQVPRVSSLLSNIALVFSAHAFIYSIPILLLASLRRTFKACMHIWVRAAVFFGIMLVVAFVFHFAQARVEGKVALNAERMFASADAALVNMSEVALLIPQGTTYQPVIRAKGFTFTKDPSSDVMQMLPYSIFLCLYFIFIVRTIESKILTRRLKSKKFRWCCLVSLGLAPVVAERMLLAMMGPAQQLFAIRDVSVGIGPFSHAFDRYSITCAAMNWLILFCAVAFVIGMVTKLARKRQQ